MIRGEGAFVVMATKLKLHCYHFLASDDSIAVIMVIFCLGNLRMVFQPITYSIGLKLDLDEMMYSGRTQVLINSKFEEEMYVFLGDSKEYMIVESMYYNPS